MNEELSEDYIHHKKIKIAWQLFVLLGHKDIYPFHPAFKANLQNVNIYLN